MESTPSPSPTAPAPSAPPVAHAAPPSPTVSRFALLALTAVAAAALLHRGTLFMVREAVGPGWTAQRLDCADTARTAATAGTAGTTVAADFRSCLQGHVHTEVLGVTALVLLTCAVALALYLLHPRLARTGSLSPASARPGSPAVRCVTALLAEPDAPRGVRVSFAPLVGGLHGRSLGFPGRYHVVLSMGLFLAHDADVEAGRVPVLLPGVLRHELAHLRNRDVGMTQLTIALWWAFLCTAALPALLAALFLGPVRASATVTEVSAALALLWFERCAVLRSREHLADTAVRHHAYPDALAAAEQAAETLASGKRAAGHPVTRGARAAAARFRERIGYHPSWKLRAAAVAHPARLLKPSLFEAATAGLLIGFGYQPLTALVQALRPYDSGRAQIWLLGSGYALLLSGVVGLAAWRAVWRARADDTAPRPRTLPLAVAACLGILAGQTLLPLDAPTVVWRTVLVQRPVAALGWALVLLVFLWAFTTWQALVAEWWSHSGVRPRPGALVAGLLLGPLLLGFLLGGWFAALADQKAGGPTFGGLPAGLLSLLIDAAVSGAVAAAVLAAAVPAALRVLRGHGLRRGPRGATGAVPVPRWWVAGACALLVVPVYLLVGRPAYPALGADMVRLVAARGRPGADSLFFALLPLLVGGAACIAVAGAVVALTARTSGGTGRHGRGALPLVALGAAAATPATAYLLIAHIRLAACAWVGGACGPGPGTPWESTLALGRWMLLPGVLGAAGLLLLVRSAVAARRLVGRAIERPRARAGTPPAGGVRADDTRRWRAGPVLRWTGRSLRAALAVVALAATLTTTAVLGRAVLPAQLSPPAPHAEPADLRPYLVLRPGTEARERACSEGLLNLRRLDLTYATSGAPTDYWLANTAVAFGSADDPGLVALARAARDRLLDRDPEAGQDQVEDGATYCALRGGTARPAVLPLR
ncbi:hypothetical protein [Streptomyces sp. NPDC097619]|uniref:hypothetical protein n=1 Tax=Streptomyces sp. NPDC097619 TaxID=3157228 RepID=UPI00332EB921